MKKLLLILSIAITLTACENVQNYQYTPQTNTVTEYPYSIYEVTYKEHDYIIFAGDEGSVYGFAPGMHTGVVHNPDCRKCNSNQ